MKSILSCTVAAAALAVCLATPASALTIDLYFNSDHCTDGCGDGTPAGQPNGGFAVAHLTQTVVGTVDIAIELLNGNVFSGGGFPLSYGFNLIGDPIITYSNIVVASKFDIVNPIGVNSNQQAAGAYGMDGFGDFEYGLNYNGQGTSCLGTNTCLSALSFTIQGAGITLASFLELSSGNGGDPANMVLDIYSGFGPGLGNTGPVDYTTVAVPGPVVGAGIPGLAAMGLMGLNFWRRRRNGGALPA